MELLRIQVQGEFNVEFGSFIVLHNAVFLLLHVKKLNGKQRRDVVELAGKIWRQSKCAVDS